MVTNPLTHYLIHSLISFSLTPSRAEVTNFGDLLWVPDGGKVVNIDEDNSYAVLVWSTITTCMIY